MKRTAVIDRRYSGLRIVEAGPADVESILPLFLDYLEFYRRPRRPATARKFLRDRLTRRESKIFLALLEGEPVGFVQLYPTFASIAMKRAWVLYDLFVAPAARRKGVAQALMQRAQKLGAETGAAELVLETAATNRAAQRLYAKLGWTRDRGFLLYRYYYRQKKVAV
jgi:ribosomal protein S18 acetylase RimI-like enzyme